MRRKCHQGITLKKRAQGREREREREREAEEQKRQKRAISSVLCRLELAASLTRPKPLKALTVSLQISVRHTEDDIVSCSRRHPAAMPQAAGITRCWCPRWGWVFAALHSLGGGRARGGVVGGGWRWDGEI